MTATTEKRMSKNDKALQEQLLAMMQRLAKCHLRETLAWTRGHQKAIDQAKTEYGEVACRISRIIEKWEPETGEDND